MAAKDAQTQAQADVEAQAAQERQACEQRREETRAAAARAPLGPVEARKVRVRGLLNRLLWNEVEGDHEEYEVLIRDLNARLDEAALSPDFEDLPIETLARRVMADMDLCGDFALSLGEAPKAEAVTPARELEPADSG
jgi:hypothetical protein